MCRGERVRDEAGRSISGSYPEQPSESSSHAHTLPSASKSHCILMIGLGRPHFIDVNTESGACYKLSRAWPTLTSLASQGRKETSESPNTGHLHSALKPGKGLMLWLSPSNAYLVCMELQSRKLKPQYFITQAW